MKYPSILLPIIFLLSCESGPVWSEFNQSDAEYTPKVTLEIKGQNRIFLDSVTGPVSYNIQYIHEDNSEILAYWNGNDKSIVYFPLNSTLLPDKQFFENKGPNTNYSSNFFYVNNDSVFSTDAVKSTYLTDNKSQILTTYPASDPSKIGRGSSPYVWTGSPFSLYKNRLFFQTYVGGIFNQPTMAYVDLLTGRIDYFGEYPEFYQRAYWRGGYEFMDYTHNAQSNLIVQSYAADHFLRIIHLENLNIIDSAFAGSDKLSSIKAPRLKMSDPGHELDDRKFLLQPSFGRVLYDSYRKVYYRFAYDGINETDIDSDSNDRATIKHSRIIVLDESFNKIGEHELPRFRYNLNMSFISKDGLNIKVKNRENEDVVDFDIFELTILQ